LAGAILLIGADAMPDQGNQIDKTDETVPV
jgi:hypothetical protein